MNKNIFLKAKLNRGLLPACKFLLLFLIISIIPTSAWTMGWFPDETSCGTSENPTIGDATINEVYSLGSTHFVEIRIFDPDLDPDDLNLQICYPDNPEGNECIQFDDFYSPVAHPYYVIDLGKNILQLQKNDQMDIILYRKENYFILPDIYYIYDYLSVNGYDYQNPSGEDCDFDDLDTDVTTSSKMKGIERSPDGTGNWKNLDRPGNNGEYTYGENNDEGDLPALHHLEIIHDGSAVACVPEEITLIACADAECSSLYLDGVDGTLTAGGNSRDFSIPAETAETDISIYVPTDGTAAGDPQLVTLGLESLSTQPIASYGCSNTSADSDSCGVKVYKAGLVFDVPYQIAGVESGEVEIKAVQSSDTDPTVCTPLFESGERSICFWGQYTDPGTGSGKTIKLDDNDIDTVVAGTTPECAYKALIFDQGSAELPAIRYDDVGKMQLHARYEGTQENEDEGLIVIGSDSFVVKPHHFEINNIVCSDEDETDNPVPPAEDHNGDVFCTAGVNFTVTVTAKNADNQTTLNFGHEENPQAVELDYNLIAPLGGKPGILTDDLTWEKFSDGIAQGVVLNWSEVGIITITPKVVNYLGAGDRVGDRSENIGRFIPASFKFEIDQYEPACSDTFTYAGHYQDSDSFQKIGQGFNIEGKVRAINVDGDPTINYIGNFAKLENEHIKINPYIEVEEGSFDSADGVLSIDIAEDLEFSDGVASWVANAVFDYKEVTAPQNVFLRVSASEPAGNDGVEGATEFFDVDVDNFVEFRYGRLALENAYGSDLLLLPIPLRAEYYNGTSFVLNEDDSCTIFASDDLLLAPYSGNLKDGDTTASGSGELNKGQGNFSLSAPGEGNDGSVGLEYDLDAAGLEWLQFDWRGDGSQLNPSARATFGIFKGNEHIIYLRETTWR
jgi:MSHA biogenesis protein MshQ